MTTAESEVPPTALISWAHAPNTGVTTDAWRRRVLELAIALRAHGVDADLDLFHMHERGVDWTRWGPQRVITADFTIVVVNKAWRERFEGFNDRMLERGRQPKPACCSGSSTRIRSDSGERCSLSCFLGPALVTSQLSCMVSTGQSVRTFASPASRTC